MPIAINTKYVSIAPLKGKNASSESLHGEFFISSTMESIGIDEGITILTCSPQNRDLKFESEGLITKVKNIVTVKPSKDKIEKNKLEGRPPPRDSYHHYFEMRIRKPLKETNLLSDLEYSIKAVDRFNNPIVHFQQQFRELDEKDFETIVKGWIYTARTAFGKLINSIPRQNKLEFMLQAMNEFSTIDFKEVPLNQGLRFLYQYIEVRILSRGRLLVETDTLIRENLRNIINSEEVGFINPITGKEDLLGQQAKIFANLFELQTKSDFKSAVNKAASENSALEIRFQKLFNKTTWPIDLNV